MKGFCKVKRIVSGEEYWIIQNDGDFTELININKPELKGSLHKINAYQYKIMNCLKKCNKCIFSGKS